MTTKALSTERAISPMRREFAQYYVGEARLSPGKAAKMAGFQGDHHNIGQKLLRLPEMQVYIRQIFGELDFERENAPVLLADELLTIAMFDPREMFEVSDTGDYFTTKSIPELPRRVAICIKSVTAAKIIVDGDRMMATKLEFYDKLKAAETLGKWLGMEKRDGGVLEDLEPTPSWTGINVVGLPEKVMQNAKEAIHQIREASVISVSSSPVESTGDTAERPGDDELRPITGSGPDSADDKSDNEIL